MDSIVLAKLRKSIKARCRNSQRNLNSFIWNVWAVSVGIKPSFLVDIFIHKGGEMVKVLAILNEYSTDFCFVNCLVMELHNGELFMLNTDALQKHICNPGGKVPVHFIDISNNLKYPCCITTSDSNYSNIKLVYKEAKQILLSCFEEVRTQKSSSDNNSCSDIPHIVMKELKCNLTTLYGVLLGYPVVYWFNSTEHCLDMAPLNVCKVSLKNKGSDKATSDVLCEEIYSFSYPSSLEHTFLGSYNIWKEKLTLETECRSKNVDLSFFTSKITLPSIVL